jgi:hypothetical protein
MTQGEHKVRPYDAPRREIAKNERYTRRGEGVIVCIGTALQNRYTCAVLEVH